MSSVNSFIEAVTEDQRPAVLQVLTQTIVKNSPPDQVAGELETLGISVDSIAFDVNCAVDAVVTKRQSVDDNDFTTDPELFSLYSKVSSETEMSQNSRKIARDIINSNNQSLLFAALKSPFAEEYVYKFAKRLTEVGGIKYLYRAYAAMPKKTNASRLVAKTIAETGDAAVIYEALTNFDVETGTKESTTLAHGLAATRAYDLMEKAYVNYDDGDEECLILCNSMALSGDVDFIQKIIGDSSGEESLKILACGLQAAAIYTQVKRVASLT